MKSRELEEAARVAARAADAARAEILPRFRRVDVETKQDGSPVTEADRSAEQAIRAVLREAYPDHAIVGEEYGAEEHGDGPSPPTWVIDPIDGTIAFSRGIPLFSTLIALRVDDASVLGLIDLPALGERLIGWRGAGCRRNGEPVRVSDRKDPERSLISHGDPFCFRRAGYAAGWERMAAALPMLRGYADAFGHAQVICGGVDAMVDFDLNLWDAAASEILVPEAGGRCHVIPQDNGKLGLVIGSPPLVESLIELLED